MVLLLCLYSFYFSISYVVQVCFYPGVHSFHVHCASQIGWLWLAVVRKAAVLLNER